MPLTHSGPFADYDRERFGGPTSSDRLITGTHEHFPELWREPPDAYPTLCATAPAATGSGREPD